VSGPGEFRWAPFGPSEPEPPASPAPPAVDEPEPIAAPALSRTPARRIAVVTCMDPRIDPLAALGLALGDAHVIRNAGAVASDDVIRSLHLSLEAGGTELVILMGHSDCAAYDGDDDQARAELMQSARRIARAVDPDGSMQVDTRWYDVASGSVVLL
jgi:carbonic anhydrase